MKILIITNKLPFPPKDGGAIATLSLALGLSNFVDEIDLLALNTSKHFFNINKISIDIKNKINFYDVYQNTDINFFDLISNFFFSKKPYNAVRFISKEFEQKMIELISQKQYDIIQFEGLYVLPYLSSIKNKCLKTYRAHNIEHEIWERTVLQETNPIKKYYINNLAKRIKKFEQSFINTYDLLVPITERDSKKFDIFENNKPKITIQTGIDISDYQVDNTDIELSLFHIGALDWSPNQEGLIWFLDNCWDNILLKIPNLKFYIAGRNSSESFENKVKRTNVEFIGEVEDAKQFISSKAVMIVPLLSGSGMRIKIIEGMALEKAIVTTSIGVEGINAENDKNILIADSPLDFSNAVINLFSDLEKIKKIGQNAKIFISENFDNLASAKKLFDFYNNHLNNKPL